MWESCCPLLLASVAWNRFLKLWLAPLSGCWVQSRLKCDSSRAWVWTSCVFGGCSKSRFTVKLSGLQTKVLILQRCMHTLPFEANTCINVISWFDQNIQHLARSWYRKALKHMIKLKPRYNSSGPTPHDYVLHEVKYRALNTLQDQARGGGMKMGWDRRGNTCELFAKLTMPSCTAVILPHVWGGHWKRNGPYSPLACIGVKPGQCHWVLPA